MKTEEEYAEYEKRIQEALERKKNRRKEWINCELETIFTPKVDKKYSKGA